MAFLSRFFNRSADPKPSMGRVSTLQDPRLQEVRDKETSAFRTLFRDHYFSGRGTIPYATQKEMRRDSAISQGLSVATGPLRTLDFSVRCPDPKARNAADAALRPIWNDVKRFCFVSGHYYGWAPMEKVWERRDMTVEPRVDSEDDADPIDAIRFRDLWVPKSFVPLSPDPRTTWVVRGSDGSFVGLKNLVASVSGGEFFGGARAVEIPAEKAFVFAPEQETEEYPGWAASEFAYRGWFAKQSTWFWGMRYLENRAVANYKARAPQRKLPRTLPDGTIEEIDAMQDMLQKGNDVRSGEVIVMPSDRDPGSDKYMWDIEVLQQDPRGDQFLGMMRYCDLSMKWAMLGGPELAASQGDRQGSYAQTDVHTRTFENILQARVGGLEDALNKFFVPQFLALNFRAPLPPCRIEIERVRGWDRELVSGIVAKMAMEGFADPIAVARRIGVPLNLGRLKKGEPAAPVGRPGEMPTEPVNGRNRIASV